MVEMQQSQHSRAGESESFLLKQQIAVLEELLAAFAPHALPDNVGINIVIGMFERKYSLSQEASDLLREMMQR